MFPRTKHIATCFYSRDKFLCLNDVNDDKLILFYCYICREIKEI